MHPLVDSSQMTAEDMLAGIGVLLSGRLTMGERVREFELAFAKFVGVEHAVMVNSGSSANLLAMTALRIQRGPLTLAVPAVCWATSLWPVVQAGHRAVLVDVSQRDLQIEPWRIDQAIYRCKCNGLMAVHVLGVCADMDKIAKYLRGCVMVEDACESLGAKWRGKCLGTIGEMGTYSFYYSHQMSTAEGGMVVCRDQGTADLLRSLRSHGGVRDRSDAWELAAKHPGIDSRFLFVAEGFNVRPTEVAAAFGLSQLARIEESIACRSRNARRVFERLSELDAPVEGFGKPTGCESSLFGIAMMIDSHRTDIRRAELQRSLAGRGIESRPIVSGNMALQPGVQGHPRISLELGPFGCAQEVHDRGVFIGCPSRQMSADECERLAEEIAGCLRA